MLSYFLVVLFALTIAHAYFDGPGQGDFLSRAKNVSNPFPGIPWQWGMMMHALIHSGAVWFITGMVWLAVFELLAHFVIDHLKCKNKITFIGDQVLHFTCKVFYALVCLWYPTSVWVFLKNIP